jgi:hypothetical protein
MIVSRHPYPSPVFVTGWRWSQGIDTRVRSFLDGFAGNMLAGKLKPKTREKPSLKENATQTSRIRATWRTARHAGEEQHWDEDDAQDRTLFR